MGNNPHSMS